MISRPEGGQDANVPVDAQIVDYNLLNGTTPTRTRTVIFCTFFTTHCTLPRKNDVQIWNEINYKK